MPAQHCTNSDKNIYLLNQQTTLLSVLWTLPSKCSSHPKSFSSSDLSRLHRGAWIIGVGFRCINLLNIHIPGVNRPYSEHWQRPSQELLLLLDPVSSLLSYRDFLGLLGNQNRLQTFSLKKKQKTKPNKLKSWHECRHTYVEWKNLSNERQQMVIKIPVSFPCLRRWFLCAWFAVGQDLTAAGVFQVPPQMLFLGSFWHHQLLRWAELSSLLLPGKIKWGTVFSLLPGCWVEADGKERELQQEQLCYFLRAGTALSAAQEGLQAWASSSNQHCVTDHSASFKNHWFLQRKSDVHTWLLVVKLQMQNDKQLETPGMSIPTGWCSMATLWWISTSNYLYKMQFKGVSFWGWLHSLFSTI